MDQQKGFSLLEILIAMAIMAIMVAVAFPNLGKNSDKLAKQEVLRLVAAIELVRDQSIILNQEYGLNVDETGYQFLVLNEVEPQTSKQANKNNSDKDKQKKPTMATSWEIIEDNPALGQHDFPEGLDINLSVDGENLFSSSEDEIDIFEEEVDIFDKGEKNEKVDPPQIYFLSSGEQNQFSIAIAVANQELSNNEQQRFYRVRGFLTGNLKYEGPLEGNLFQDLDEEFENEESENETP